MAYTYRTESNLSISEPTRHITPIVSQFDENICYKCKKNRRLCWCGLPYPTDCDGLYSRAQFDSDMDGIEQMSQQMSRLLAANTPGSKHYDPALGCRVKEAEKKLAYMRQRCAGKLFATAKRLQDNRDKKKYALSGAKEALVKRDKYGVRLSTSEQ